MATTQNTYTGNGSTVLYSFTFPYLATTDIKVSVNGTNTTAYSLANATTIQFTAAPANGAAIRIFRTTDDAQTKATFFPGSSIRAQSLNENFTQNLYVTQEANNVASSATTVSNSALAASAAATSTANTSLSNSTAAVTTANTASTNAAAAVSTSNAASTSASTALSNSTTALSTANTALSTANSSATQSATALTNSATALSQSNTALTQSSTAVAASNSAVSVANTASTNATTAVTTANSASSTASSANSKADQAISAVSNSINYTLVSNVAAIPASPTNNTAVEIFNSTGIESFTPLSGKPAGFVGSSQLSVRMIYATAGSTWNWVQYFPNDPETRYLKVGGGTLTGPLTLAGAPTSNLHPATKAYVDGYVSSITSTYAPLANSNLTGLTSANSVGIATWLRFSDADASNYVSLQAPAVVTSNLTLTLPATSGTNGQFLKTDGSGNLSFATVDIPVVDTAYVETPQTITVNKVIAANTNAALVGPTVTVGTGVTITISTGSSLKFL